MSSIAAVEVTAALTANGGADGFVTVTSNAAFYPGAIAYLVSSTVASQQCLITELSGATKIGLRFINNKNVSGTIQGPFYGRNDCSAYLTANNASINMPTQAVRVNDSFTKLDKV